MTTLTKHRTVLDARDVGAFPAPEGFIALTQEDDDTLLTQVFAYLSREDWQDFGSPAQLTVTFEPGNLLGP